MSNLQNQYIDESFQKLVQVSDDGTILDGTGSVITSLDLDVTTATTALSASTALNANSASYALTASYVENIDLPAGVVSGSSQVILQDTSGDLSGSRISGTVDSSVSSSYAVNATSSSFSNTSISSSHSLTADTSISSSHSLVADQAINATNSQYADNTVVYGKNLSGAEIPKGTPLYFTDSGTSGNLVGVYPADAANPNRMPAAGVAGETLQAGAEGVILLDGFINGVDTSLFASGDPVYVAAGGGYTNQRPTGSSILVQGLGYIEKSAVNGSGVIQGSGRANDVPNIQEGFGWFGNSDGVAEAQSTASFAKTDKNNVFTGTQTYDNITVNGTGSFAYIQSVTGSAKVIGDAFIILNNDLPAERYAGIVVQDSGSGSPLTTASLQFDGQENDWFYQYSDDGGVTTDHGIVLFGPEYSTKGTPTYPTNNRVQKGNGGHHLLDSNILDDGSNITLDSKASVTGDSIFPANSFEVKDGLGQTKLSVSNAPLKAITGIDVGILGKLQVDDLNVTNNTTVTGSLIVGGVTNLNGDVEVDGEITPAQGKGLNLADYSSFGAQPSFLRFYSGSNVGGTNYINMQVEPTSNGRVTISSFPTNNHFMFFDPKDGAVGNHRTYIESILEGGSFGGPLRVGAGLEVTGSLNSRFTAPPNGTQYEFFSPQGCNILGTAYNNVWFGMGDYGGTDFSDYFSVEYYDSFGYNFGGEMNVNGRQCKFANIPNGGGFGQIAEVGTRDVGDTTSLAFVRGTKIEIGSGATTNIKLQGKTVGNSNLITEAIGGNSDVDFGTGNYFILNMTGNSTLRPINIDSTNGVGQTVSVRINTGGNTLSFDSIIKWQDGTAPTLTGTAIVTFQTFSGDNVVYATSVNNLG